MVEDFLWRQFLFFCYRNGLWYGESGGLLEDDKNNWWTTKEVTAVAKNDDGNAVNTKSLPIAKIISSYDVLQRSSTSPSMDNTTATTTTDNNIIVFSSLERTLRQI
jgi:hypothetical protein